LIKCPKQHDMSITIGHNLFLGHHLIQTIIKKLVQSNYLKIFTETHETIVPWYEDIVREHLQQGNNLAFKNYNKSLENNVTFLSP
ncbi:hypothetical protein ACJX0J_037262, partial [Zea mays]